jgi:iron complex transport system substrate-binding protein
MFSERAAMGQYGPINQEKRQHLPLKQHSSFIRCVLAIVAAAVVCSASVRAEGPQRVLSLDYCADQFVLQLVPRENIAALSMDAREPFSFLREEAVGIPQQSARTEAVLLARPDLVVSSYGGGPGLKSFLERSGIALVQVGWIEDLAGVRRNLLQIGEALGNPGGAARLLEDFDTRLAALREARAGAPRRALYVTPGGVTGGPGTLVHELLLAAGLHNFAERPGWQALPLERLAYEQPDVLVNASFVADQHPWSAARHPLLAERLRDLPAVSLPGAWTACGGWFLIEAVEAMAVLAR